MIKVLIALLVAHHAIHPAPLKRPDPSCQSSAVLLGVVNNLRLEIEQFRDADLYALESMEKTGWLSHVVGPGDLLIAVHQLPDVQLFVFYHDCFISAGRMPDDKFRVLWDRTRS